MSGDYRVICDICGFKFWNTELRRNWKGLMVCSEDFEHRNRQEFVRGVPPDKAPYGSKALGAYTFLAPNEVTADDL